MVKRTQLRPQAPEHFSLCHARLDRASSVFGFSLSLAFCLRSRAISWRGFSAASPSRIRCVGYNNGEAAGRHKMPRLLCLVMPDPDRASSVFALSFVGKGTGRHPSTSLRYASFDFAPLRSGQAPVVPYRIMVPARRGGPVCPPCFLLFLVRITTLDSRVGRETSSSVMPGSIGHRASLGFLLSVKRKTLDSRLGPAGMTEGS